MPEENRKEENTAAAPESDGTKTSHMESQIATMTRSQERRAAKSKKSSKKEKRERRSSRAEPVIMIDDEEVVEEAFDENSDLGEKKTSPVRTKSKVTASDRSGFVPPTQVSGPRSADKALDGKRKSIDGKVKVDRSSGYVAPTRVSGPRSSKKTADGKVEGTTSSDFVPPTRVAGRRPSKRPDDGKAAPSEATTAQPSDGRVGTSGYVPPTSMPGPRPADKGISMAKPIDDGARPSTTSSGYVPPISVSARRPSGKRSSFAKPREDNTNHGTTSSGYVPPISVSARRPSGKRSSFAKPREDNTNHGTTASGYVPPTSVSARRPSGKGISMATPMEEGNNIASSSSGYVPPTHVSAARSADKAISRKNSKPPKRGSGINADASGFVPPTSVSGPRSADKTIDGKVNPTKKSLRRGSKADKSLLGSNRSFETGNDATDPPSTSAPPVSNSVDILPGVFTSCQPSNIEMNDSVSMYADVTVQSEVTAQIRNVAVAARDDQSLDTFATLATSHTRNRAGSRVILSSPQDLAVRSVSLSSGTQHSTDSIDGIRRPERRTSSVRVDRRPMSMMMNEQGHTMSDEELRAVWERSGQCIECGTVQTHKKEKYGPFGTLRRMKPLTVEGHCYGGYCLRCHDVYDLRRLFNDDSIPLDLPRNDAAEQSLRRLQTRDEEVMELAGKRSPLGRLCSSVKFQIFVALALVGVVVALVFLGISLTKDPDQWVPPPPTSAPSEAPSIPFPTASPTSYEWNVVSEIIRDDVDSFGHHVGLSSDGQTLAVVSPKHDFSRGRLDVYRDLGSGTEWAEIGDAVVGGEPGDELGFSMSLSGDGSAIAVGSPGRDEGLVQVFFVDEELGLVPKGQIISGPTPLSQFGYSLALNYAGDRLFVGAPQFALNVEEVYGMVQAFDFDGQQWVQSGSDIIGPNHGSRFGHSISTGDEGKRVVVGAPLDDEKWEDAGQIHWYELRDGEWIEFLNNMLLGSEEQSYLGTHVSINSLEQVVLAGTRDETAEEFPNAGAVSIWGIDWTFVDANPVGFPLPGTHENAMLGYDVDVADDGELIISSGQNTPESAGSVLVFVLNHSGYLPFGKELFGPALGEKDWFGSGPSVAVAARHKRVAIGYENILSDDGVSHPTVRIYDYYAVTDYNDVAP